jgi:hypothetical protein
MADLINRGGAVLDTPINRSSIIMSTPITNHLDDVDEGVFLIARIDSELNAMDLGEKKSSRVIGGAEITIDSTEITVDSTEITIDSE